MPTPFSVHPQLHRLSGITLPCPTPLAQPFLTFCTPLSHPTQPHPGTLTREGDKDMKRGRRKARITWVMLALVGSEGAV